MSRSFSSGLRDGTPHSGTYRICQADGRVVWVEDLGWVIEFDAAGRARRMVGALRDVTDAVITRSLLDETEAHFADLVESVPGAIVRCRAEADGKTVFTYVGPKCSEIWVFPQQKFWLSRTGSGIWLGPRMGRPCATRFPCRTGMPVRLT